MNMAQARVKKTGEIVELTATSKNGKFAMEDIKSGKTYSWNELERVAVKSAVAPVHVSAVSIQVNTTVSGTIQTNKPAEISESEKP